ncbi:MAG TPA: phospho-sugar mutase, partial [Clostridia bacterium]|nr:phospho-sugar mutase [Clostridia bacterium]
MYVELYNNWVRNLTGDEKRELMALTPAEREDRFYKDLEFGTAGMRGIIALGTNRMNKYTVMRATAGLADLICDAGDDAKRRGVTISYDSRKNSYLFACVSAQVLAARGIAVQLFADMRPVPVLSFAIRRLRAFAGIMITASHNPPEYNGYKVYGADGAQMGSEDAGRVVSAMEKHGYFDIETVELDQAHDLVKLIGPEFDEVYFNEISRLLLCPQYIKRVPDFKIVYTPLHGTGRKPVCGILSRLGVKNLYIVAEQAEPDENFSTVEVPNPEQKEAYTLAIRTAQKVGAD